MNGNRVKKFMKSFYVFTFEKPTSYMVCTNMYVAILIIIHKCNSLFENQHGLHLKFWSFNFYI